MSDDTPASGLPVPPAVPRPKQRGRRITILLAVGLLVLVGGFFFGRSLWWSLRPTPDFPALADDPDPSLHGTVAFWKPYPNDDCVYVVAASGGTPTELTCFEDGDGGGGELAWLADGRLQVTAYATDQESATVRKIVNIETGQVETVTDEIPDRSDPPSEALGPNGEVITSSSSRGNLTVTLTTDQGTRTLLSVGAPDTYTLSPPAWDPDGDWFVVKDDLDRLLIITTSNPSQTRILINGGWGAVVTNAELTDPS